MWCGGAGGAGGTGESRYSFVPFYLCLFDSILVHMETKSSFTCLAVLFAVLKAHWPPDDASWLCLAVHLSQFDPRSGYFSATEAIKKREPKQISFFLPWFLTLWCIFAHYILLVCCTVHVSVDALRIMCLHESNEAKLRKNKTKTK